MGRKKRNRLLKMSKVLELVGTSELSDFRRHSGIAEHDGWILKEEPSLTFGG